MPDQDQRYHRVDVGDDEIVIYDRENEQAWVQSDVHFSHQEVA